MGTEKYLRPQHPSGRPQHDQPYRRLPILRLPNDGPLVPGLRRRELSSAIGFRYEPPRDDDDGMA